MRVHLQMLGCRLNEAELQGWAREFATVGHEMVSRAADADLVVLNTCAVTAEAARKSRQQIRRARRQNPEARLVVTGCYSTLEQERAGAEPGVEQVIDNRDKARLVQLVDPVGTGATRSVEVAGPRLRRGRDRAFVKIQDGCRYSCAYCIVTVARGEEVSRPDMQIVEEVAALHAAGVNEVVLSGVHVGGYGDELGESLARLVGRLLAETGIPRLRLASVEPWAVDGALLDCFADRRLMPHLHLPLQSGADPVLRRMARRCRRDDFLRLVERVRTAVPGINLTTDVIAGFPGESEADWAQTVSLVEAMEFGDLHVFPFSPRAGTRAARLPDPVPESTRHARARELLELGARLRRRHLEAQVGRVSEVLIEGDGQVAANTGYTPDFLRVVLEGSLDAMQRGSVVPVRLLEIDPRGAALRGAVCA
jgi:threonylcarbamoyladenosine tRNA methylthiotransferase MtaB